MRSQFTPKAAPYLSHQHAVSSKVPFVVTCVLTDKTLPLKPGHNSRSIAVPVSVISHNISRQGTYILLLVDVQSSGGRMQTRSLDKAFPLNSLFKSQAMSLPSNTLFQALENAVEGSGPSEKTTSVVPSTFT
jgi:hypothetical protein